MAGDRTCTRRGEARAKVRRSRPARSSRRGRGGSPRPSRRSARAFRARKHAVARACRRRSPRAAGAPARACPPAASTGAALGGLRRAAHQWADAIEALHVPSPRVTAAVGPGSRVVVPPTRIEWHWKPVTSCRSRRPVRQPRGGEHVLGASGGRAGAASARTLGFPVAAMNGRSRPLPGQKTQAGSEGNFVQTQRLQDPRGTGATGLEPATSGVTGRRSNQLSYAPRGRWRGSVWHGVRALKRTPPSRPFRAPEHAATRRPAGGFRGVNHQPGGGALCPIVASACGRRP